MTWFLKSIAHLAAVFLLCAYLPSGGGAAEGAEENVVFLKAFYPLDEPRFHCVDVPGHRSGVNTAAALVVHTCKEGMWNLDERFDLSAVSKGALRMPAYGLCVVADSAAEGAKVRLRACDGRPLGVWRFENYRLSLEHHPEKCLTIGAEPSRLTPGGHRFPSRHVARSLGLATCAEEALERQLWRLERPMRRTGSIMPFK